MSVERFVGNAHGAMTRLDRRSIVIAGFSRIPHEGGETASSAVLFEFKRTWVARVSDFWHNPGLQMTKTELQGAIAEATSDRQKNVSTRC